MNELLLFYTEHFIILGYLVAINVLTFGLYAVDKLKARANAWRIAERTLLLFALAGGSPGAILAMKLFRHKTKKDSFLIWFVLTLALQIITLLFLPTMIEYTTNLDISF
jgi:uncharacterized membrane protein YsdA (DUF1294 family)